MRIAIVAPQQTSSSRFDLCIFTKPDPYVIFSVNDVRFYSFTHAEVVPVDQVY